MTWDQIASLTRNVLTFAGGFGIARGWINAEQLAQAIGGVIAIVGVLWSLKANTKTAIIQSAAALPEVRGIDVTTKDLAQAVKATDPTMAVSVVK